MIALGVFEYGKFMTFRELQLYFEFQLLFTVRHLSTMYVLLAAGGALIDNQSQVLNTNVLRDKL